jgi:hypothetical protein
MARRLLTGIGLIAFVPAAVNGLSLIMLARFVVVLVTTQSTTPAQIPQSLPFYEIKMTEFSLDDKVVGRRVGTQPLLVLSKRVRVLRKQLYGK